MFLRLGRRRWLIFVMLAAMGFAQASLAFSDCQLDRAALAALMQSSVDDCEHAMPAAKTWIKFENRCFAHCTADLQTVGHAVALVRSPADAPVLALAPAQPLSAARIALDPRLPSEPPPRIRFRTLLI